MPLPTFLPGHLTLRPGTSKDYRHLEPFHYRPGAPATWAAVWTLHYHPHAAPPSISSEHARVVAVAVLSYPVPAVRGRSAYFGPAAGAAFADRLHFANANIRTISRVVVHPQFRGLGLASTLISCCCNHCPTRYVEALAVMGRAHPMFEKAGMTRVHVPGETDPASDDDAANGRRVPPAYFIYDRHPHRHPARPASTNIAALNSSDVTNTFTGASPRQGGSRAA